MTVPLKNSGMVSVNQRSGHQGWAAVAKRAAPVCFSIRGAAPLFGERRLSGELQNTEYKRVDMAFI